MRVVLTVSQLVKRVASPEAGGAAVEIVRVPELSLAAGEQVALRGESGSGKTTFLHLIAGILAADEGKIVIDGEDVASLGESQRDRAREARIGYIFQTFNLLQGYTVLENVVLGMSFGPGGVDRARARQLLERVGLGHRLHHFPRQLSTGQQQRVAVARALANRPKLVLADEPTGNLDRTHGREALGLIREACREAGAALLLVSHDPDVLAQFERVRDFAEINQPRVPLPRAG
ncbi:MAG: ABC transporter ATP-binding protein [Opitutaceae bacterium]|nr:ABC transporter ATP-binding protein [Opitutaceae bacterium]